MKKLALIAATAGSLATRAVAAPAEARGGFGPGLAGRSHRWRGDRRDRVERAGIGLLRRLRPRLLWRLCTGLLRWIRALLWIWVWLSAGVSPGLRLLWRAALLWRLAPRLALRLVSQSEQLSDLGVTFDVPPSMTPPAARHPHVGPCRRNRQGSMFSVLREKEKR